MKMKGTGRIFRALAAAGPVAMTAACVSPSLEDAAPQAALRPPLPATAPVAPAAQAGSPLPGPHAAARDGGDYPNLNVQPASAAEQMSEEEIEALTRQLTAERERLGSAAPGGVSAAELHRLRLLARTHAQRQLDEIERGR